MLVAPVPAFASAPPVTGASSSTHPDDAVWYTDDSPLFEWDSANDLPELQGSIDTSGNAFDIAVSGDVAYIADQEFGVHAVDISNPSMPTMLGTFDTPGRAREVVVDGDLAYVADRQGGIRVLDVSEPGTMTARGSYVTAGYTLGLAVEGSTAYLAEQSNGLVIVDVSDPDAPALLGSVATTGTPRHIAVAGDMAYLAEKGGGLKVFDVADPSSPTHIATLPTADDALGIAVSGDIAYVAAKTAGLAMIDISTPSAPALVGSVETSGAVRDVSVDGDVAYLTDKDTGQLYMMDVSDSYDPYLLATCDTPGQSYGVTIAGHWAYVAEWGLGMQTIQVSRPATPTLEGEYDTPMDAFGVAVDGDAVYIADLSLPVSGAIQVADVADPSTPTTLGAYTCASTARDIQVDGDLAFVAENTTGLRVLDISDPTTPVSLGVYDTPGFALALDVAGDTAYIADHNQGLQIIDVSQPGTPTLAGTYNTPGIALGVAVAGEVAYVADHTTLQIVDISLPGTPALLASYPAGSSATDVIVEGDVAYFTDKTAGLTALDVSDPSSPQLLDTYDSPDVALRLDAAGDSLYLADKASGLLVLDISDPADLSLEATHTTAGDARDVAVAGDMAYVAAFDVGLEIVNIADGPVGYSYELDQSATTTPDGSAEGTATTAAYSGLADGEYWFHVSSVGVRHDTGEPSHVRVRIDQNPPTTTDDVPAEFAPPFTVSLAATDTASGLAQTYWTLGSEIMTGTAVDIPGPGTYTLQYWSVDVAGNVEATHTVEFGSELEVVRRGGRDRYATSAIISESNFDSADEIILATGWTYADALSASGLAGCLDAPILVTWPQRISDDVEAEIARLGATRVTIVGGTYSVSQRVEDHLRDDLGLEVRRIGGIDRYETSQMIAEEVRGFGLYDGRVYIASGEIGADALSLSPLVYTAEAPLVLTRKGVVPAKTQEALQSAGASLTVLAGGTGTITEDNLKAMEAMVGTDIDRVWGTDRYGTAAAVAAYGVAEGLADYRHIGVANGSDDKFADSLCGGPAIGALGGIMALTRQDELPAATRGVLTTARGRALQVQVFGGTASVSDAVMDEIRVTLE